MRRQPGFPLGAAIDQRAGQRLRARHPALAQQAAQRERQFALRRAPGAAHQRSPGLIAQLPGALRQLQAAQTAAQRRGAEQ